MDTIFLEHQKEIVRNRILGTVGIAAMLLMPSALFAASFNCTKAGTSTEIAICNDSQLGTLDEAIADAFFELKDRMNQQKASALLQKQRDWLAKRNSCGGDIACLRQSMQDRLAILSGDPASRSQKPSGANNVADGNIPVLPSFRID